MQTPSRRSWEPAGLPVPALSKAGAATLAVGLGLDLVEHVLGVHAEDTVVAGFAVGEHIAHLVVLVGMILVLAGIVAQGTRVQGRRDRPEGSPRDAVR